MKKDIQFSIKLYIPAGKASSAPPIGPVLGQYRLNLIEFCKDFNSQTEDWEEQTILPVLIIGYYNNSLEYIIKAPTTTFFCIKPLGLTIYQMAIIKNTYRYAQYNNYMN